MGGKSDPQHGPGEQLPAGEPGQPLCVPWSSITAPGISPGWSQLRSWMVPASRLVWDLSHPAPSVSHTDCPTPAPHLRQALPSGWCGHSHPEPVAELGMIRNAVISSSCCPDLSVILSKLYIHSFRLLGKPQAKSTLGPGKMTGHSLQLAKQFSSFSNSHKSFL